MAAAAESVDDSEEDSEDSDSVLSTPSNRHCLRSKLQWSFIVNTRLKSLSLLAMTIAVSGCVSSNGMVSFNRPSSKEGLTTMERQLSMARLG